MQKSLIIIILLALGGGFAFWYARSRPPAEAESRLIREAEERLEELRRIRAITLDTAILQDPLFRSLRESESIPSPAITPGRANPFLPL